VTRPGKRGREKVLLKTLLFSARVSFLAGVIGAFPKNGTSNPSSEKEKKNSIPGGGAPVSCNDLVKKKKKKQKGGGAGPNRGHLAPIGDVSPKSLGETGEPVGQDRS